MNTILWVFIAFAGAIIIFTSIQDKIPDEFGFLKNKGVIAQSTTPGKPQPGVPAGTVVSEYQGWSIRKTATAVEFVRPMTGNIVVNGTPYPAPEFGLLCNNGKLDMRIDTRMATTGRKTTTVDLVGTGKTEWDKSTSKNIFPKDSRKVLTALYAVNPAQFTISYAELGAYPVQLDTSALALLLQALPASCR